MPDSLLRFWCAHVPLQEVYALAKAADPDSSRTLGVLTKADAIEERCHGRWMEIMRGAKFPLKLVRR